MAIRVLEVTEYPPAGHGYDTRVILEPSWDQVEAAVRALDHYCLPFIFVGLRERCLGEDCLSVLGGPNGYAITGADSSGGWLNYSDPEHAGGEVPVWTSDQGYYPIERHVCYDLSLVLRVVRLYAERGEFDPSVYWEG